MRTGPLISALLIAACAAAAAPDAPPRPSSPVFSLGGGGGWGRTSDNGLRVYDDYARIPRLHGRETGAVLALGAGWRLDDLRVGLEGLAWSRRTGGGLDAAHLDLLVAAAAVTWHPWRGGLFGRLGYGLGSARLDYLERGLQKRRHDTGTSYLLALGYDIALSGGLSLSPQISTAGFATRDLEVWASLTALTLVVNYTP